MIDTISPFRLLGFIVKMGSFILAIS